MDCLHACEIFSAAHDGEPVDAASLAEARTHAGSCNECRVFLQTLARITEVPEPSAPDDLVDRLASLGQQTAVEIRAAQVEPSAVVVTSAGPHSRPSRSRWLNRYSMAAAAAVLVVAAMSVTTLVLSTQMTQTADTSSPVPTAGVMEAAPPAAESDTADSLRATAPSEAPSYVTLDGGVWLLANAASPAPSAPTTAGVLSSELDEGAGVTQRRAYWSGTDRTTLYVQALAGRYLSFVRVTRNMGLAPYGLMSGTAVTRFGEWPTLPARFAAPVDADGSPSFRRFGFDDLNAAVYVPIAGRIEDGLAIAPGSSADDPAGGNPGWSWWEPLP